MVDVLENKRASTRFRILVEIAERQPAVSQGEIAEAVGVTSQAVSEYIRDLVEEGLVEKEARSRYAVTKEGVDWLLQEAHALGRFADHVTEDVLGSVQEEAAIAAGSIAEGEAVTLSMVDGLLHATPGEAGPATGVATGDADAGRAVGVTGFEGIIDLEPGTVTVVQIPPVRSGGPDAVDHDALAATCEETNVVAPAGVEAVVALGAAGVEYATAFAAGDVAADAASRGLDVVVVATADQVGRVTAPLQEGGVSYRVSNPSVS
jgi:putative transcriptional regulator